MTKLRELKAAAEAAAAAWADARDAAIDAAHAAWDADRAAAWAAHAAIWDAYYAELKKTKEQTND